MCPMARYGDGGTCMYLKISAMKSVALYIILSVMLLSSAAASGQSVRDRQIENEVITAVEKYDAKDFSGAASLLMQVVAKAPDNDAACFYLGLCEFCMGHAAKAEEWLKKAVSLDPSNFWYRYRLAMVYSAAGKPELTTVMFEQMLKDFPKKNEIYYNLIDLYLSSGQTDKALETLGQIETLFGKNESTALTRFDLLRQTGRTEEAYESLRQFNEEYTSPRVLSVLGDYYISMYNDSLALSSYEGALEIMPGYAPALLGKAEVLRITRRYDRYFPAIMEFVQSTSVPAESKADYLTSLFQRSDPMFLKTFTAEIDTMVNGCVSMYANDSTVLSMAGVYYYGTERPAKAEDYFRRNMQVNPESISAATNFIEFLMYTDQWDRLSSDGRAAFRRFPSEPAFLEMASLADYHKGDYRKVLGACDTIIAVAAGDSARTLAVYTTMGDMYHQLGENAKAYKAYDKALKINPSYVPVLNNYAYFLSIDGKKLKKAYSMSKVTVEAEPDNPTYLDTFGWILYLQGKPLEAKPFFKHAMLYGGKESPVILDHYAEVLYALGEYDLAFVYWTQAQGKNNGAIPDLDEKIRRRKAEMKK